MASRTSTSVGMAFTVTLLGVLMLASFIAAIVFYGQKQRLGKELVIAQDQRGQYIRADEQNSDSVLALIGKKPGNESLVGYLQRSLETAMQRVTGSRTDTIEDLESDLEKVNGADTASLIRVVQSRESDISRLEKALADAESAREAAEADLQAEVDRLTRIEQAHSATVAALNDEVGRYKTELDRYRGNVNDTISQNNSRVDQIRADSAEVETTLRGQLSQMQEQVVLQQEKIRTLERSRADQVLQPTDEFALVDARVVSVEGQRRQVYVDAGRDKRVVLGMSFAVYSDAGAIQPDENGDYPPGKATVEVIRVDEKSSLCRIIRETRGNPIVVGDVAANAIYDPAKTYTFVVFGNFDANRDGIATPQERNGIVGLIGQWGGRIAEDVAGDVDFLVLGERPLLPPQPPPDAPIAVVREYIRKQQDSQQYDRLFETATQTGIPVLNENRLYTLTGYTGR